MRLYIQSKNKINKDKMKLLNMKVYIDSFIYKLKVVKSKMILHLIILHIFFICIIGYLILNEESI